MEKSIKIIDIVFKTISKLSDDEIEGIINREGKLVYVKDEKVIKTENRKGKNVLDVCGELDKVYSRDDAYKILSKGSLKREDIVNIANYYEIKVLKSYTKVRIIDSIVESVVGIKVDKGAIKSVDIR